jgi:O-antigen/teichoic acid export membrane protein
VLQLAAVVVFVGLLKWGVGGALLALVISVAATGGHNLVVLRRKCGLRYQRPTLRGIFQLLGYGSQYYVASIGYMANTRIGIVLIAFFLTPEEIGYFAAAVGIVLQAGMISDSVETAVLPRMAQDATRGAEIAGQAARLTLIATGVPLGLFALFCRPIIALLFSPEFLPSVPLILLVLPGLLLWSAGKILLAYFLSRGRPSVASWAIGIGIGVNVVSLFMLLPRYGLAGAAMAMSLGFVVRWAIACWAFHAASGAGIRATWAPRKSDLGLLKGILAVRLHRRGGRGRESTA